MSRLLARCGAGLTAAACLWLLTKSTETAWWLIGLAGAASLVLVALATVVPGLGVHPARRYVLHARLGRWALALALVHVAAIPVADNAIWLHFTPAMPYEIAAGVAALVCVLGAVLTREPLLTARLPSLSLAPHRMFAAVAAVLAAAHVALIPGLAAWTVALLGGGAFLLVLPILLSLVPGRRLGPGLVALAGLVALGAVSAGWLGEVRMAKLRAAPLQQRTFDHASHAGIVCTACHHNFVDGRGAENCLSCHKAHSNSEWTRIDRTFHAFCAGCHAERRWSGEKSGPVQSCKACHARHASTSPRN